MKTPTLTQIAQATQANKPYFFARKTLRFFGQTRAAFKVKRSAQGRIFIFAPIYRRLDGGKRILAGYTFREFVNNNALANVPDAVGYDLAHILEYIQTH